MCARGLPQYTPLCQIMLLCLSNVSLLLGHSDSAVQCMKNETWWLQVRYSIKQSLTQTSWAASSGDDSENYLQSRATCRRDSTCIRLSCSPTTVCVTMLLCVTVFDCVYLCGWYRSLLFNEVFCDRDTLLCECVCICDILCLPGFVFPARPKQQVYKHNWLIDWLTDWLSDHSSTTGQLNVTWPQWSFPISSF